MVGFTRKKVKSYTLGEKLKRLREEACISIAEIAKATKIRKVYLEKLEEGKYEEMPAEVYTKGFLKSYAQYLGIDASEVLRQYEKERGVRENIKKHQLPTTNTEEKFRPPMITVTPKMFTVAAFAVLVLAGIFYFYQEIGKFSATPRLVVMQPAGDLTVDGSSLEVVGLTDRDSKVMINEQPIYVNDKGEFNETLSLQQGVNTIEVKSTNRFGKETKKAYSVSANYETPQIAGRFKEAEQTEGQPTDQPQYNKIAVEIRVEEKPIWVSVEVDGKNVQSGTMLAGSSQQFEGENQISVTSGKANKTFIKLNGQDIGVLGDSPGVVRDVIFTKDTKLMPQPAEEQATEDEETSEEDADKKKDDKKDKKKDKKD